ncbi:MAG TPA: hypothetical protein VEY12_11260 [Thermoplasmata archaeon]|nr:hypothetical protein [Thermoplasmata archaeon]
MGYVLFLAVFPTVSFPASGEAPFPLVFLLLAASALVAGFAAEDLLVGIGAAVFSLFGGVLVAGLMGLSPLASGLYLFDPGSMFGFLVRDGFVFLVLAFTINLVGVVVGYGLRERLIVQRPRTFAESVAMHRK